MPHKRKKVRRYVYNRNEDMGDVRLEERMTNRTEYVGEGKRQAGEISHKLSPRGRTSTKRGIGGRRGRRAGHRKHSRARR